MTWIVDWNGKEYDIDPGEFTGLELSEIKRRTGFTYLQLMTDGLPKLDAEAIRVVFWIVDRRSDPDLKFSEYAGPKMKQFLPGLAGFPQLAEELGKALEAANEAIGSESSASSTDGAPPIDLNA